MKASEKPKYVAESRDLLKSVDIESLISDPNNLVEISKINRLIAIFTNFSSNDGQELKRLFQDFQTTARRSTSSGTIKNRLVDVIQFIGQKIEEMDIYEITDEPIKTRQDKIVKELKNDKFWVRSSLEGKDMHLQVGDKNSKKGEHVHLISDSRTGELRVHAEDKAPSELITRVVSIVTKEGTVVGVAQQGIKTTMEFIEPGTVNASINNPPVLYATGIRHSGGPNGHFALITIKNIGKEIALDIQWGIRAFGYEWISSDEAFELEPNKEREVSFPISGEVIFNDVVPELNVIMEYKDAKSKHYFTRRELQQVRVPSGAFFDLKATSFHPPVVLVDDGLKILSEPFSEGDKDEMVFEITVKDERKKIKIGMSRSLSSVLGFNSSTALKQAISELAHRKIRKMVKEDNISDYLFSTWDLTEDNQEKTPFERYVKLRDSI